MPINVTPIPRIIDLAVPAFTLGTSNAAGSAETAVSSNSTLLAFDATLPDAITFGQSGAAGSATVTARRDHAHAMQAAVVGESKISEFSRTASAGAGAQAITGIGFQPIAIYMIGFVTSTLYYSHGFGDSDEDECAVYSTTGPYVGDANNIININSGASGHNMWAVLTSLDSDGFTVTWGKGGNGQDVTVKALCWGP